MEFQNAELSKDGAILLEGLSGRLHVDTIGALPSWAGVLVLPDDTSKYKVPLGGPYELTIGGKLRGEIILRNYDGIFQGSGPITQL